MRLSCDRVSMTLEICCLHVKHSLFQTETARGGGGGGGGEGVNFVALSSLSKTHLS